MEEVLLILRIPIRMAQLTILFRFTSVWPQSSLLFFCQLLSGAILDYFHHALLGWLIRHIVLQFWHCILFSFFGRCVNKDSVHFFGHSLRWYKAVPVLPVSSPSLFRSSAVTAYNFLDPSRRIGRSAYFAFCASISVWHFLTHESCSKIIEGRHIEISQGQRSLTTGRERTTL